MRGAKFIGGQTQIAAFSLLATKYFNKIIHFPFKIISYWQPNMWTRYLIYKSFLVGWFLAFLADYNLSEWKTPGKIFGVCWVTSHQRNGNYPPNAKLPVGYTFYPRYWENVGPIFLTYWTNTFIRWMCFMIYLLNTRHYGSVGP